MIGTRLGPYRIERRIGAGGMGTVYLGRVEEEVHGLAPGGTVALKIIHPHLLERTGFRERFVREARIGRQVAHENVVRTYDLGIEGAGGVTQHYLVMEHVEGRTLRDLLSELRTVPEALLRELARQITCGLSAIHGAGIVHRDLKPENVLVTEDHRVRIMDLGVARELAIDEGLTAEGQFTGSVHYAAPEQFRGRGADARSDLYALGVLLLELATGENPFRLPEAAAVVRAHLHTVPPRALVRNPEISPFLSEVIAALLEKDPAGRFPSAAALLEVLSAGEAGSWWRERERLGARPLGRRARTPVGRETRILGREADLETLRAALSEAATGKGSVVLVEGEAGIGKTRLVDEFLLRNATEDVHEFYGAYAPAGGLGALSEAILDRFGRAGLAESLAPWLTENPRLVPAFAAAIQHEAPPPGCDTLEGDAIHALFARLLQALARDRTVLFVVDDIQFAGRDSRSVLLGLARAVEGHRVLLVLTSRPGIPPEDLAVLARLPGFRHLHLERMGPRLVIELLREAFRSEVLAERLGGKIAYKSDGVPYFVFELLRGLREGRFIAETSDGSYVETRVVDDIEVPSAVRDLVLSRLSPLTDEDRELLDLASVQGAEFEPDVLARAGGLNRVRVLQRLASLERRTGLVRSGPGSCRFDHHQVQEVLYQGVPPDLRAEYHSLVAEALAAREAERAPPGGGPSGETVCLLAGHHLRGNRPRAAQPFLSAALDHLERTHRNEAAIELAGRALEVPGLLEPEERLSILRRRAERLAILGRRKEEREALLELEKLAETMDDLTWRARAAALLGKHSVFAGRPEEGIARLTKAVELADRAGSREIAILARGQLGNACYSTGRYDDARREYEAQLALSTEAGNLRGRAGAMGSLGNVDMLLGRFEEARGHYSRAMEAMREAGDRQGETTCLLNLGTLCVRDSRPDEAGRWYEQALELASRIGYRRGVAIITGNLAILSAGHGRIGDSLRLGRRSLEMARETGDRDGQVSALLGLSAGCFTLGDLEQAERHAREARRLAEEAGARRLLGSALSRLADIAGARPADAETEALHRECLRLWGEIGYEQGHTLAQAYFGSWLVERGRGEEARPMLMEALATARRLQIPPAIVLAAGLLGRLPGGDPEEARREFRRHEAVLDVPTRLSVLHILHASLGEPALVEEAHALLVHLREGVPPEHREGLASGTPVSRWVETEWARLKA